MKVCDLCEEKPAKSFKFRSPLWFGQPSRLVRELDLCKKCTELFEEVMTKFLRGTLEWRTRERALAKSNWVTCERVEQT